MLECNRARSRRNRTNGATRALRTTYVEGECTRPLVNRVVEECVTSELRHHKQHKWPRYPKNSSNDRNVEHDGNWQDEEGNAACVVVGARTRVAIDSKKTLKRNQPKTHRSVSKTPHHNTCCTVRHCVPDQDWRAWLHLSQLEPVRDRRSRTSCPIQPRLAPACEKVVFGEFRGKPLRATPQPGEISSRPQYGHSDI